MFIFLLESYIIGMYIFEEETLWQKLELIKILALDVVCVLV